MWEDHGAAGTERDRPPPASGGHPQPGQFLQSADSRAESQGAEGSVQLWSSRYANNQLLTNQVSKLYSLLAVSVRCLLFMWIWVVVVFPNYPMMLWDVLTLLMQVMFFSFSSDAFDNELIRQTLGEILQGETVHIPVYDFVTHSRWALPYFLLRWCSTNIHCFFLFFFWKLEFSNKSRPEPVCHNTNFFWTTVTYHVSRCNHSQRGGDFSVCCSRKEEFVTVYPADVVLVEGILMFYSQEIRDLFQLKLFVDTDPDTRLSRRGVKKMLAEHP